MIRRVVACCRPHEFLGKPGALMQGTEVIMAVGDTENEVNDKLGDLLFKLGWTKREDERWECAKHEYHPADACEGFTLAFVPTGVGSFCSKCGRCRDADEPGTPCPGFVVCQDKVSRRCGQVSSKYAPVTSHEKSEPNLCQFCGRDRCVDEPGTACPGVLGVDMVQRDCPSTKREGVKHPGPWQAERACISGPHGGIVWSDSTEWRLRFIDEEAERLILAAPELLSVLKAVLVGLPGEGTHARARALIERIEKGTT